jgi:hypothetical protein
LFFASGSHRRRTRRRRENQEGNSADGKVESDQQYRGFRWWNKGGGSRTSNNHFTRDVVACLYPTTEEARITSPTVDAAAELRDLNFKYMAEGKGATVTARFGLVDQNAARHR